MKERFINIDWLELYCHEMADTPHDSEYYKRYGYNVERRVYGTPQYREMFTVYEGDQEFLEIRRDPYATKQTGGFFDETSCHIRLCNSSCYEVDPFTHLRYFLLTHGYRFDSITRIDIALDFQQFDGVEITPSDFVQRYMQAQYSKVNQSGVAAHGKDYWSHRNWNSVKWGSPRSPVSTKLYNKSLELREVGDKPYIRERWQEFGFDLSRDVWRLEFSLSSQQLSLQDVRSGIIKKNALTSYDTRAKLLFQFQILASKYFDFRTVERTAAGTLKRKYECPRVPLFVWRSDLPYKPVRNVTKGKVIGRTLRILANKCRKFANDDSLQKELRDAAAILLNYLCELLRMEKQEIRKTELDGNFMQAEVYMPSVKKVADEAMQRMYREIQRTKSLCKMYGIRTVPDDLPF